MTRKFLKVLLVLEFPDFLHNMPLYFVFCILCQIVDFTDCIIFIFIIGEDLLVFRIKDLLPFVSSYNIQKRQQCVSTSTFLSTFLN